MNEQDITNCTSLHDVTRAIRVLQLHLVGYRRRGETAKAEQCELFLDYLAQRHSFLTYAVDAVDPERSDDGTNGPLLERPFARPVFRDRCG
jgi:hypothetical protein